MRDRDRNDCSHRKCLLKFVLVIDSGSVFKSKDLSHPVKKIKNLRIVIERNFTRIHSMFLSIMSWLYKLMSISWTGIIRVFVKDRRTVTIYFTRTHCVDLDVTYDRSQLSVNCYNTKDRSWSVNCNITKYQIVVDVRTEGPLIVRFTHFRFMSQDWKKNDVQIMIWLRSKWILRTISSLSSRRTHHPRRRFEERADGKLILSKYKSALI